MVEEAFGRKNAYKSQRAAEREKIVKQWKQFIL